MISILLNIVTILFLSLTALQISLSNAMYDKNFSLISVSSTQCNEEMINTVF